MTQLEYAKNNILTPIMRQVAKDEGVPAKQILCALKSGTVVIPKNIKHRLRKPCGIGRGLRTKVNANIGTSTDKPDIDGELDKLNAAVKYGSDAVMDLSTGGELVKIRRKILQKSVLPVGTVPVYEIAVNAEKIKRNLLNFNPEDIFAILNSQAQDGVDFFTIHAGVTRKSVDVLKKNKRVTGIVSRGGAILAAWMNYHKKENPFYEYFDRVLDIASRFDVTLSLGDGLRPGSIADSTDSAQIAELKTLGQLCRRARAKNVQVMIEGPGHIPLNEIKKNVELEKRICDNAPFYVLGPLVTDIAAGYDHISASIGGAIAGSYGADFLCYVTPAEHLRHPDVGDVREGVIAAKISAHAADIAKGLKPAIKRDLEMTRARKARDWKKQIRFSIDPEKAKAYRSSSKPKSYDACTMCGRYCSMKLMEDCLRV